MPRFVAGWLSVRGRGHRRPSRRLARASRATPCRATSRGGPDEQATNFALALGAGVALPLTRRLSVEMMAKDHIASFKSVRDLAAFGVTGRRAHTVLLLVSARFDI
ncbi:hypothetical protein BH24GEM1_BH24GEM1_25620 [soil metagenome]